MQSIETVSHNAKHFTWPYTLSIINELEVALKLWSLLYFHHADIFKPDWISEMYLNYL